MNRNEHRIHFQEYYLAPVFVAIAVISIVGYLVYDAVKNYRDIILMAVVINDSLN